MVDEASKQLKLFTWRACRNIFSHKCLFTDKRDEHGKMVQELQVGEGNRNECTVGSV